jgi:glucuronate isomerase
MNAIRPVCINFAFDHYMTEALRALLENDSDDQPFSEREMMYTTFVRLYTHHYGTEPEGHWGHNEIVAWIDNIHGSGNIQ